MRRAGHKPGQRRIAASRQQNSHDGAETMKRRSPINRRDKARQHGSTLLESLVTVSTDSAGFAYEQTKHLLRAS